MLSFSLHSQLTCVRTFLSKPALQLVRLRRFLNVTKLIERQASSSCFCCVSSGSFRTAARRSPSPEVEDVLLISLSFLQASIRSPILAGRVPKSASLHQSPSHWQMAPSCYSFSKVASTLTSDAALRPDAVNWAPLASKMAPQRAKQSHGLIGGQAVSRFLPVPCEERATLPSASWNGGCHSMQLAALENKALLGRPRGSRHVRGLTSMALIDESAAEIEVKESCKDELGLPKLSMFCGQRLPEGNASPPVLKGSLLAAELREAKCLTGVELRENEDDGSETDEIPGWSWATGGAASPSASARGGNEESQGTQRGTEENSQQLQDVKTPLSENLEPLPSRLRSLPQMTSTAESSLDDSLQVSELPMSNSSVDSVTGGDELGSGSTRSTGIDNDRLIIASDAADLSSAIETELSGSKNLEMASEIGASVNSLLNGEVSGSSDQLRLASISTSTSSRIGTTEGNDALDIPENGIGLSKGQTHIREKGVAEKEKNRSPYVDRRRRTAGSSSRRGEGAVFTDLLTVPGIGARTQEKLIAKGIVEVAGLKQLYLEQAQRQPEKMADYLRFDVGIMKHHAASIAAFVHSTVEDEQLSRSDNGPDSGANEHSNESLGGEINGSGASSKPRLTFCVEGNISVGKTTFLQRIVDVELRDLVQVVPEPIGKWQDIEGKGTGEYNILDRFYADPERYAYTFQNYVFVTRMMQERDSKQGARPLRLMERSVFSDRMVFVRAVHEAKWMDNMELCIYDSWFDPMVSALPGLVPDAFIYLRANPTTCHKRLQRRARGEEGTVTLDYLTDLHEKHEEWLLPTNREEGSSRPLFSTSLWEDGGFGVARPEGMEVYKLRGAHLHSSIQDVPALVLDCDPNIDFSQDLAAKAEYARQVREFFAYVGKMKAAETAQETRTSGGLLMPASGRSSLVVPDYTTRQQFRSAARC
eukprot:TRINITY_DN5365_c0_g3_i1.p1 TRINITY_DN5365_c0_g3~~TRINITY_DN5365_c0_g3_i1.p1  ORF type:complete len:932 (+),score=112.73 TRINITY_DN5365_c0_g3_i1:202-2997(+)